MDVAIISALIGAVGSLVTTIVGALLTHYLLRRGAAPQDARAGRAIRGAEPHAAPVPEGMRRAPARVGAVSWVLLAVGAFLAFTGFAMAGYVILSFITTIFAALQSSSPRPPDLSDIPFVPFLPLGFGLLFAGIEIAWLGFFAAGVSIWRARPAH